MQHREQDNKDNREHSTEQDTENSAHNYRTYSLDYYHEYVAIKNSDTIEIYTISK